MAGKGDTYRYVNKEVYDRNYERIFSSMKEWKFNVPKEPVYVNEDFWYAINNGYIDVEELIVCKDQRAEVLDAIKLLDSLDNSLVEQGVIEYG